MDGSEGRVLTKHSPLEEKMQTTPGFLPRVPMNSVLSFCIEDIFIYPLCKYLLFFNLKGDFTL